MDSRDVPQRPTDQHDGPTSLLVGGATSPQHVPSLEKAAGDSAATNALDIAGAESQEPPTRISGPPGEADVSEPVSNAYGTRSRNRSSKINYAEDQDLDIDGISPPVKASAAKNASSGDAKRTHPAASDTKATVPETTFTRFVTANGVDQPEKSPSSGREPGPSTSTKKRKVQGNATLTNPPPEPAPKRHGPNPGYIPPANMTRASNMMFFEKSKAVLRKGSLVADDGTVLNVDGKSYQFPKNPLLGHKPEFFFKHLCVIILGADS